MLWRNLTTTGNSSPRDSKCFLILTERLTPTLALVANVKIELASWVSCFPSWFPFVFLIDSCQRSRFPLPGWFRWAQPQGDMGGQHGLLNDCQQLLTQLIQVDFLAQGGTEGSHYLRGIVLAAVETPVNQTLDATAERLEQPVNRQRGEDDGHAAVMADDATQQRLQPNHQAHVDPRQDDRQRTIHQRTIDEHINVPQPVAQHGKPKRERDQEPQQANDHIQSQRIE